MIGVSLVICALFILCIGLLIKIKDLEESVDYLKANVAYKETSHVVNGDDYWPRTKNQLIDRIEELEKENKILRANLPKSTLRRLIEQKEIKELDEYSKPRLSL